MALKKIGTIIDAALANGIPVDFIPPDIQTAPVYVNPRLRVCLGKAVAHAIKGRWIELNPKVHADPEQLRETLAHEIAHHIAGIRSGHDWKWQAIARALGSDGKRCLRAEAAQRIGIVRDGRVVGRCERCGFEVRRRKPLAENALYTHRGCGGRFERVEQ